MTLFAGFGITDKPLDNDAFFKAGSEQLKVSTNSKSNLSAAQSIGDDAKHAQNAVFDGNDPKLSVSAARPLNTPHLLLQVHDMLLHRIILILVVYQNILFNKGTIVANMMKDRLQE